MLLYLNRNRRPGALPDQERPGLGLNDIQTNPDPSGLAGFDY